MPIDLSSSDRRADATIMSVAGRSIINLADSDEEAHGLRTGDLAGGDRNIAPRWLPQRKVSYERVAVDELGPGAYVLKNSVGRRVPQWSKIFVPLIFCALGRVPEHLKTELRRFLIGTGFVSTKTKLKHANRWWARRLSKWDDWCKAIREKVIGPLGEDRFCRTYLYACTGKHQTPAVFGQWHTYGFLPHPPEWAQNAVLKKAAIDGEVFLMVRLAAE